MERSEAASGSFAHHLSSYARLTRLDKPIGIWLLLWPTLWALWIASEGRPSELVLIVFVAGTVIMRSAGCIINDFADRDFDAHVERTARRPLATREIAPIEALALFLGLMLIALGLVLSLNRLTLYLACGGAVVAVLYPFAKRFIAAPQLVLGVAFAWGVPMAFAAELEYVPQTGWLLFLAAVIWGVLYDTEYAMVDRDDDVKVGIRSTAVFLGDMDRFFIVLLYALFFATLSLVGRIEGLGAWYFGGLAIAAALAAYQLYLIRNRARDECFRAFLNNAWLGGWVFAGVLLDFLYRAPAAGQAG